MAQRIVGPSEAQALFVDAAAEQRKAGHIPDVTPAFLERLERKLAGSVGAATAHAMVGQITGDVAVTVEDLMRVADETAQMMEHSSQLETKSRELEGFARQLQDVNDKLTQISLQKDAFLSLISHELRTPMTSIRSFSEVLRDGEDLSQDDRTRYSAIIHDETLRLTRLLDDLLDLSVLESGRAVLDVSTLPLGEVIDQAVASLGTPDAKDDLRILRRPSDEAVAVSTHPDRLAQVFINIISNAQKYCDAPAPALRISVAKDPGGVSVTFIDNGSGIPPEDQAIIFEKFARLSDTRAAGGAGLGLAICREIMTQLGGSIDYMPGHDGAAFRVRINTQTASKPAALATNS